jgi:hypothetical protein
MYVEGQLSTQFIVKLIISENYVPLHDYSYLHIMSFANPDGQLSMQNILPYDSYKYKKFIMLHSFVQNIEELR